MRSGSKFARELVADKGRGKGFVDGFGRKFGWGESGKRRRRVRENEEVSESGSTHLLFSSASSAVPILVTEVIRQGVPSLTGKINIHHLYLYFSVVFIFIPNS